ncbi:MAG: hypothetical protein [Caudoviricetes sp.]|nr:MAG: hypothetical protein [Caudoviricetes sp.]
MKIVKLVDHDFPVFINLDQIVSVRVSGDNYDITAVGWEHSKLFSISENDHLEVILLGIAELTSREYEPANK